MVGLENRQMGITISISCRCMKIFLSMALGVHLGRPESCKIARVRLLGRFRIVQGCQSPDEADTTTKFCFPDPRPCSPDRGAKGGVALRGALEWTHVGWVGQRTNWQVSIRTSISCRCTKISLNTASGVYLDRLNRARLPADFWGASRSVLGCQSPEEAKYKDKFVLFRPSPCSPHAETPGPSAIWAPQRCICGHSLQMCLRETTRLISWSKRP